jgi:hypothetical protein
MMDRGLVHVEGHDKGKVEIQLVISICLAEKNRALLTGEQEAVISCFVGLAGHLPEG